MLLEKSQAWRSVSNGVVRWEIGKQEGKKEPGREGREITSRCVLRLLHEKDEPM